MSSESVEILSATGDFLSPNPAATSRSDFTSFFERFTPAPDADAAYTHLFHTHQQPAVLLLAHPAMARNRAQTFSTPAASKNKLYFTWDFALRTFQYIAATIEPQRPKQSKMFSEVMGRAAMLRELILDDTGNLEAGNASLGYKDDAGVEFTDEIKELAKEFDRIPEAQ